MRHNFCAVSPRTAYWSALGVPLAGPILPVVRKSPSGTRDFFIEKVCGTDADHKKVELANVPAGFALEGSLDLVRKVAATPSSIGFVSSTLTTGVRVVPLAPTSDVPPVVPNESAITTERYPITRRLYLCNNANVSADARELYEFAASEAGQHAAETKGFVPLIASAHEFGVTDTEPTALRRAVEGAKQLDLSFHFGSGRDALVLDNFAQDNIDRVRNYAIKNPGTQFLVLGFADNVRSKSNYELSLARAQAVARQLEQVLVKPVYVEGFAEALQINTANSEAARQENRRAEIWVK